MSIFAVLESYCHLSGDLFGWEMLPDGKLMIWIADMAGHGIRAGLASAVLRVLIDNLPQQSQVHLFVYELNRALHDCIRPLHHSLYATVFLMTLDHSGRAVYCSAAHPPSMVRRHEDGIEQVAALDRPVGLFADTSYRSREFKLNKGDCILLYTDGLVEAEGYDSEPFGRERLETLLGNMSDGPRDLTQAIYNEITSRQDINKLDDDVTFLAVKFRGSETS